MPAWSPAFKELLQSFNDHQVRYLIVGGYAVVLHGHPRSTIDLDLWVEPSEENADSIVAACKDIGVSIPPVPVQALREPGQIIRIGVEPFRVDLITTMPGLVFEQAWRSRSMMGTDGFDVPVIDLQSLRLTKKATGRFQDLADIENLPEPDGGDRGDDGGEG